MQIVTTHIGALVRRRLLVAVVMITALEEEFRQSGIKSNQVRRRRSLGETRRIF